MKYKLFRQVALFLTLGTVVFLMSCEEDDPIDPPVASFTSEVNGAVVTFTNTSEGEDNTYEWSFGDGTTSIVESPTKTYTESGDFTVTLTATNGSGSNEASEVITISAAAVDDQPPVITLVGDAAISIAIGEEFTDPGATAEDNVDGTITENIEVEGEVNTLQPGEYVITYNVSDAAGNAAEEVTRTVTVTFDAGLVTNGTFDDGTNGWIGNAANVQEDGGNFFNFANVETAGNPFDVNLSQVISMSLGNTYELSFNASTGEGNSRTILVGIGLNEAPFTNVAEEVTLSDTEERFTYQFTANFGSENSRIIFDMGADVGVVVLDNISLKLISENTAALPFDFENEEEVFSVFSGAAFEFAADPSDETNTAGKITNSGAAFEGVSFFLGTPVDFSTDKIIKMRFNTPTADIPVLVKFENGAPPVEVAATATTNGWQELEFDFSAASGSYSQITVFVDGPGTSAGDFYIDDISQEAGGSGGGGGSNGCDTELVAATTLPVNFEGCETFLGTPSAEAGNGTFGAGLTVAIDENPDKTGINTSDFALRLDKAVGADFFAGVQNAFPAGAFDITGKVIKAKIYSSKPNTTFKFELLLSPQTDPVTGNPAPQTVVVADANVWTEVEFEFSAFPGDPSVYNQIAIKPDDDGSNVNTTVAGTYYIDDIEIAEKSGGGGGGETQAFCNTNVKAFGGDAGSDVLVSIFNVDAQTMRIEVTSADADPVDALVLPAGDWSPVPGISVAANDDDADGTWVAEFFFPDGAPATVDLYWLWSKASFGGNWQSHNFGASETATVAFDATCE